jgi:mono/diheme cytochrome c family protein
MKKLLLAALFTSLVVPSMAFAADLTSDINYKAKCAMCHGANAEGKPSMKVTPLKSAAGKSEAELTDTITKGMTPPGGGIKMPPFAGKLTPEQIKTLVSEIKALK